MFLLPGHLLLLVAEVAGFAEIQALRLTCKWYRDLLDRYEYVVTKSNVARYPFAPSNHMLASDTRQREVIPKYTFDVIRELEIRQRCIDEIINSDYLAFWNEPALQDVSKTDLIRAKLKRALWLCSSIGDLEAHSIQYEEDTDIVPHRSPSITSMIHQDIILRNSPPPPDGLRLEKKEAAYESNSQEARARQILFIQNLSVEELAGIEVLGQLTRDAYMRTRAPSGRLTRPEVMETAISMAENVIRHGVFFLHSRVQGCDEHSRDHAELLVDENLKELRLWEKGDPSVMPGLSMNVSQTLARKVGCETQDVPKAAFALVREDEL